MATSGQAQTAVAFYSTRPAILYGKKIRVDMSHKYKEIDLKVTQMDHLLVNALAKLFLAFKSVFKKKKCLSLLLKLLMLMLLQRYDW